MLKLEELSQEQVGALDFNSTIAILTISPLEEHGPHLPVGTDLFLARSLAEGLGEKIEQRWPGKRVVLCPSIPLGSHVVWGKGSVSTRPRAVHDLVFDYVRSLARSGFRYVVFSNAHAGIAHIVAMEEVAERALRELGVRAEPALSRVLLPFLGGWYVPAIERHLGRSLTPEERAGLKSDCHGGQWETGAMLNIRPELVHSDYTELPPVVAKSWMHLHECMVESCRQGLGYIGSPGLSTPEYAQAASIVIQEKVLEQVDRMLHSTRFRPSHTPFYYWYPYRTPKTVPVSRITYAAGLGLAAGLLLGAGLAVWGSGRMKDEG